MTPTSEDLVGKIWTTGRPQEPNSPINALPMKFAGRVIKLYYTIIRLKIQLFYSRTTAIPTEQSLFDGCSVSHAVT